MKRHRELVLVTSGVTVAVALFAACGFPEVSFEPDGAGGDGHAGDTGLDAGNAATDASDDALGDAASGVFDAGVILDANPDVAVAEDAGGKVDASGCMECDCDHDGYNDPNRADCGPGPYDCDDKDSRSHPGQIFLDQNAEPPMNGNWNCDDKVEKGYQENINCEALLLGLGCTSVVGFTGTVGCGQKGKFVRCKQVPVLGLPLACGVDPDQVDNNRVQACK